MKNSIIFAYLFFSLFVFVCLSLLVSQLSSTFSQLFPIFNQSWRVFDFFSYSFFLIGFFVSLYALILAGWNQKEELKIKAIILVFCLTFIALFVFSLSFDQKSVSLIELALYQKKQELSPFYYLDEVGISLGFYFLFVFIPFLCSSFGMAPNPKHPVGSILKLLKPSINVSLYMLIGYSLQSYFHQTNHLLYLESYLLLVALALLIFVYKKEKKYFGFYELVNLVLLGFGILIFAYSSSLISNQSFSAKYSLFMCGFIAWCAEWMFAFGEKKV